MKEFEPQFRQFVSRFVSLDETTWGAFFKDWKLVEFGRKETISRPGEVEDCLYFVVEGTQRIYYFDEENREATLVLTYPHSFAGVMDSFLLQSPSNYYFETITYRLPNTCELEMSPTVNFSNRGGSHSRSQITSLGNLLCRSAGREYSAGFAL